MRLARFCLLVVACILVANASKDEVLSQQDQEFCKGELQLSYPDMDVKTCMIVPQEFRERISQEWGPPQVKLATAKTKKLYTLMMVDPDAPSRANPTRSHWRHWLMVDIEGNSLNAGDIKGTVLSAYARPTPPQRTGFHRYQFLLYQQPQDQVLSLSDQEKSTLGNWDPQAFVERFGLVGPVASLQFLTQNYKD